jgi:DNA (cytosine-5)-methyltransferase 1
VVPLESRGAVESGTDPRRAFITREGPWPPGASGADPHGSLTLGFPVQDGLKVSRRLGATDRLGDPMSIAGSRNKPRRSDVRDRRQGALTQDVAGTGDGMPQQLYFPLDNRPPSSRTLPSGRGLTPLGSRDSVVGLFAGIGGIELGLHRSGYVTELLCEIDSAAQAVLRARFPGTPLEPDVRRMTSLPSVDLVAAGFPCQDLSQAGKTAGIGGSQSSVVASIFRLLRRHRSTPRWLVLENVPFMLQLQRGRAMRFLVEELELLGFTWAYRVIDTRAFGLPQRRQRVLLLASRTEDPRTVLFNGSEHEPSPPAVEKVACGFYWTEGYTGLGWAVDAVPTLKAGSTIGIPSPPAIRMPLDRSIVTPNICDAERLQGFPADWTFPAVESGARKGVRWKLVGNAVSVPLAEWLGQRLRCPVPHDASRDRPLPKGAPWPKAAWGAKGKAYRVDVTMWPVRLAYQHLAEFLEYPTTPLSERATAGFLRRMRASRTLRFPTGFKRDIAEHLRSVRLQNPLPLHGSRPTD